MINDRRVRGRVRALGEVVVEIGDDRLRCRCLNVSALGLAVLGPRPAAPGERTVVYLRVEGLALAVAAVVARARSVEGGWLWGLRLDPRDAGATTHLADAVARAHQPSTWVRQAHVFVARLLAGRTHASSWLDDSELVVGPVSPEELPRAVRPAEPQPPEPLRAVITGDTEPMTIVPSFSRGTAVDDLDWEDEPPTTVFDPEPRSPGMSRPPRTGPAHPQTTRPVDGTRARTQRVPAIPPDADLMRLYDAALAQLRPDGARRPPRR